MTPINSVCVYCGSNPGRIPAYATAAGQLAQALVKRNIRLVYGGAWKGIMGELADRVMQLGGQAIGVIPRAMVHRERAHKHLTELHVTHSMHERKMLMAELADGFIALPGGIGTLEELFEIWTWAQLGFHGKPIGLLNVAGYYDSLLDFLDHTLAEEFVKPRCRSLLMVDTSPEALLERFSQRKPAPMPNLIGQDQT